MKRRVIEIEKIMVVDDQAMLRKVVRDVLEQEGYFILDAVNADDAWIKIQQEKPNLILLDIMMPGMSAIDFIRNIKENPKLRDIKIVYLTAVIGTKKATEKLEGVIGAIEKPFKNEELISVVKEALSHIII